jgi:hypothetical protein
VGADPASDQSKHTAQATAVRCAKPSFGTDFRLWGRKLSLNRGGAGTFCPAIAVRERSELECGPPSECAAYCAVRPRHGCTVEVEALEFPPAPDAVVTMRAAGKIPEEDIERAIKQIENALARYSHMGLFASVEISGLTAGAVARDVG